MNKYTELSDFQINKAVFIKLYGEESLKDKDMFNSFYRTDYCNNPSDAMPIIIENKIAFMPHMRLDAYLCKHGDIEVNNKILYRGAMEVFLIMKDEESNND